MAKRRKSKNWDDMTENDIEDLVYRLLGKDTRREALERLNACEKSYENALKSVSRGEALESILGLIKRVL